MLAIRETYRIACERMTNENSLYRRVTTNSYGDSEALDKIIAIGSHVIDVHVHGS